MQVPRAETLEGRAETLRSAQSLPRTEAVAVAPVQALLRLVPEGAVAVSVLREQAPVLLRRMAAVLVGVPLLRV